MAIPKGITRSKGTVAAAKKAVMRAKAEARKIVAKAQAQAGAGGGGQPSPPPAPPPPEKPSKKSKPKQIYGTSAPAQIQAAGFAAPAGQLPLPSEPIMYRGMMAPYRAIAAGVTGAAPQAGDNPLQSIIMAPGRAVTGLHDFAVQEPTPLGGLERAVAERFATPLPSGPRGGIPFPGASELGQQLYAAGFRSPFQPPEPDETRGFGITMTPARAIASGLAGAYNFLAGGAVPAAAQAVREFYTEPQVGSTVNQGGPTPWWAATSQQTPPWAVPGPVQLTPTASPLAPAVTLPMPDATMFRPASTRTMPPIPTPVTPTAPAVTPVSPSPSSPTTVTPTGPTTPFPAETPWPGAGSPNIPSQVPYSTYSTGGDTADLTEQQDYYPPGDPRYDPATGAGAENAINWVKAGFPSQEAGDSWAHAFAAEHDGLFPWQAGTMVADDNLAEHLAALKWGQGFYQEFGRAPNVYEYGLQWWRDRFGLGPTSVKGASPGGGMGWNPWDPVPWPYNDPNYRGWRRKEEEEVPPVDYLPLPVPPNIQPPPAATPGYISPPGVTMVR